MLWKKKKIDEEYVKENAEEITDAEVEETLNNKEKIEDKIKNSGLLRKYFEIFKLMLLMLNDYRKGRYTKVPWLTVSTLVFILLYVLNPLDLIPDFIPVIGYLDDVSVLMAGLNLIQTDLRSYIKWKEKTIEDFEIDATIFD